MTNDDKIKDEKLQYNINKEAAIISALSSGKIDKYEYLTSNEILLSDKKKVIQQATFTYSSLGKALENQRKTIEDQGRKHIDATTNENERLATLTNKGNHEDNYKYIFEKLGKEGFDEIKQLADETNHNDLIH